MKKKSILLDIVDVDDSDLRLNLKYGIACQVETDKEVVYGVEYYNKYVYYDSLPIAHPLNEFRCDLAERYCKSKILDIGIGSGRFLRDVKREGYGFDVNKLATHYLETNSIFLNPYMDNLEDIDCFTFFDSLEHIINPDILLHLIPSRSHCIISIPIFNNVLNIRESKHYRPNEHFHYFTSKGFKYYMSIMNYEYIETFDTESIIGRENILTFVFRKHE